MSRSGIDIIRAKKRLKQFLDEYENLHDPGFQLKAVHTYHVADNAAVISQRIGLDEEDRQLAELIGLLHDIGRFEEIRITRQLNNLRFDHAGCAVSMLFDGGLIREFIDDDEYDEIIRAAVINHSRYEIEQGLSPRQLLHAKLIRDSDKTDNFRVKIEEKTENLFPGQVTDVSSIENGTISDGVMAALRSRRCVNLADRITPLDYYVTIAGFCFDISFKETRQLIRERNLISRMLDRYEYRQPETKAKIAEIRRLIREEGFME